MKPNPSRASVVLAAFPRGPKSETRVSFDTYKGRSFLNLRLWYMAPDAAWRPTRRGITFAFNDLHDLERAIHEAIRQAKGAMA